MVFVTLAILMMTMMVLWTPTIQMTIIGMFALTRTAILVTIAALGPMILPTTA